MRLIGFNFTKINMEKKSSNLKNLKVSANINILDIKKAKSEFFSSSDSLLGVTFEYSINYEKDIATLNFQGNVAVSVGSKQAKGVLEEWKNKQLPEDFKVPLFNLILKKSSLKALQFEEEFNLPPHIPMPSFKSTSKKD